MSWVPEGHPMEPEPNWGVPVQEQMWQPVEAPVEAWPEDEGVDGGWHA